MRHRILLALCVLTAAAQALAQREPSAKMQIAGIAFYNLENLFDTIPNNPTGRDQEYTPQGSRQWDTHKYRSKLHNLAYAISRMATNTTPMGPAIIGVSEVENRAVLDDLVGEPKLAPWHLEVIHHDSPDPRGIDVACLYNPAYFQPEHVTNHPLTAQGMRTRSQMCVVGSLLGQRVAVIINHWPSRLGGKSKSSAQREAAAALTKHIADSLWQVDPEMGVIIMGDLNDNPMDRSVAKVLGARKQPQGLGKHGLYNPWWSVLDNGVGTLTYDGRWNLFDQIIVSGTLVNAPKTDWTLYRSHVHNFDFLRAGDPHRGHPLRTYSGGEWVNGYSDHFPTEIFLRRYITEPGAAAPMDK